MAKRTRLGRCIHCLNPFESVTDDHGLPESWYPDTTPPNLERWTAPSCAKGNGDLGEIEKDLLMYFVLCFAPDDPAVAGLSEKVHRSIDPRCAKDEVDALHRQKRRERLYRRIGLATDADPNFILPDFGLSEAIPIQEQLTLGIRPEELHCGTVNIVRGLTWVLGGGSYIEDSHEIHVQLEREEDLPFLAEIARMFGEIHHRGPGIHVALAAPREDPSSGVIRVTLWERFRSWAEVAPKYHRPRLRLIALSNPSPRIRSSRSGRRPPAERPPSGGRAARPPCRRLRARRARHLPDPSLSGTSGRGRGDAGEDWRRRCAGAAPIPWTG